MESSQGEIIERELRNEKLIAQFEEDKEKLKVYC